MNEFLSAHPVSGLLLHEGSDHSQEDADVPGLVQQVDAFKPHRECILDKQGQLQVMFAVCMCVCVCCVCVYVCVVCVCMCVLCACVCVYVCVYVCVVSYYDFDSLS